MLWRVFYAALVAGCFLLHGCATRPPEPVAPNPIAVRAEIMTELQKSALGWNSGDLDAFLAVYAEDATFAGQDRFIRGKRAIRELYAPVFGKETQRDSLRLENLDVNQLCPDAALVTGIYQNMRGDQVTRKGTTSLVMRLIAGQWRIIHDHSS